MASIFNANDAAAYERNMGRWSRRLAVRFIEFAAIDNPYRILDVGCGTGSLTFALADAAPRAAITGIDHSDAFVAYARAKASDPRLTFEQGDAAALPYDDASFDTAVSLLVLNFVPEAERAAREMARVTKPGGVVAAAVWDYRGGMTFLRVLLDTAAALDPAGDALRSRQFSGPFTSPGEFAATWTKIGLRHVVQGAIAIRADFESFTDYWQPWLGGQGPVGAYVTSLSPARREQIEHHVRLAYLAGGSDGPRSFAATAWAVRGVR